MKIKTKLRFAEMPVDYESLCRLYLPRPIHDEIEYENTVEVTDAMAVHYESSSPDQKDYFDLLCSLIVSWDEEHVTWPKVTGLQMLKFMLENHDMSGADLSRMLGGSRSLGPMILRGERSITAEHARVLGKYFAMEPGEFIRK